jgi:hypothetical protein
MTTSPRHAWTDADDLWVELTDGRTLGIPLAWFPRLLAATPQPLAEHELSARGIHWDALDEDISIDALLAVQGDLTRHRRQIA